MRLTAKEIESIQKAFKASFLPEDHLWLFGSRVCDDKKGGDIDLYIETNDISRPQVRKRESKFFIHMILSIGDQKIDIIINQLSQQKNLMIYDVARQTGVLLV